MLRRSFPAVCSRYSNEFVTSDNFWLADCSVLFVMIGQLKISLPVFSPRHSDLSSLQS